MTEPIASTPASVGIFVGTDPGVNLSDNTIWMGYAGTLFFPDDPRERLAVADALMAAVDALRTSALEAIAAEVSS